MKSIFWWYTTFCNAILKWNWLKNILYSIILALIFNQFCGQRVPCELPQGLKKCNLSLELARQSRALKSPQPISKKCIIKGKKKAWPKEYRGVTSIPHFWSWWSFFCDLAVSIFNLWKKNLCQAKAWFCIELTSFFVNAAIICLVRDFVSL